MKIEPYFSGANPYDGIEVETRTAEIRSGDEVVFRQENVEVPASWSQLATNIVASKYFYGAGKERESSVKQLIDRVCKTITHWGVEDGYFDAANGINFYRELAWLCVNQHASFNSPVWFNVGLHEFYGTTSDPCNWYWDKRTNRIKQAENPYEYPQVSACILQGVEDSMVSIMDLARSEAMLFKYGSGSGSNLSTLRASCETLSGGGKPSGPISFMRLYDQVAEVVTSGGRTRRAALLSCLDIGHPDIAQFISCKSEEEAHAKMLVAHGVSPERAAKSVMYQNMNLSVRVTDEFMRAVEAGEDWATKWVTDSTRNGPVYKAADLLRRMAECAWGSGDPGIQFDTTINNWHTCPKSGRCSTANPCGEIHFINHSACNLASINLLKFRTNGYFDVVKFQQCARIFIIAQDILVDRASYPTKEVCKNSHTHRPLGLGYTNLGALLMSNGLPYDSDEARSLCSGITSLMQASAALTSVELADTKGPFEAYDAESFLRVMEMHADADARTMSELKITTDDLWDKVLARGREVGFRNAQFSALAPTGTISFMMDCDTTGIEPELSLVKTKTLFGGGTLRLVNQSVAEGLKSLGYAGGDIQRMLEHLNECETLADCGLSDYDMTVFATALGDNAIPWLAHLKMMAAAQPFISGAISKTVNLPHDATVEDVLSAYMLSWKNGLKSVTIYRDGSKGTQPLNIKKETPVNSLSGRVRLPDTRQSLTHKFTVGGHQGYITVGLYPSGKPGEIFISVAKEGSTLGGIFDCFGIAVSIGLQYGVPLSEFIDKFSHVRFEPMGLTKSSEVKIAKSIVDYIFRWLAIRFTPEILDVKPIGTLDAPICDTCGQVTVRVGSCYLCYSCGTSGGCS